MDLFETLGLGPRQPEENELYVAIYVDPAGDAESGGGPGEDADLVTAGAGAGAPAGDDGADTLAERVGLLVVAAAGSRAGAGSGAGAWASAAAGRLEALRARCTAWMLPYTTDYVWNKDPLVLRTSTRQQPPWARRQRGAGAGTRRAAPEGKQSSAASTGGEGCVWSVMRFGDAVDDEWWAVWLLLRMTRELQDLTVQVWDNDGQFLLIEAAYALPRWLKPETADNRVWLRCGRLHVIPLPTTAAPDLPPSPTPAQALAVLREGRYATASPRVQRPIDERLAGYPGRARSDQQHVARCLLPMPLAAALQSEPQLVAELVAAFYFRDADDMRAASRMRVLPPSLDRVPVLVRMTRCHYAQLAQQRFSAPRGVPMPPSDSPMGKAADLGLKLTVAAEMICARQQACAGDVGASGANAASTTTGQGEPHVSGPGQTAASGPATPALSEARFAADPTWRRFKSSLESNGYFQGNIPGSRRYKELLMGALEAFAAGLAGSEVAADGGGESGSATTSQQRDARRRLSELVRGAADAGLKAEEFAASF